MLEFENLWRDLALSPKQGFAIDPLGALQRQLKTEAITFPKANPEWTGFY